MTDRLDVGEEQLRKSTLDAPRATLVTHVPGLLLLCHPVVEPGSDREIQILQTQFRVEREGGRTFIRQ